MDIREERLSIYFAQYDPRRRCYIHQSNAVTWKDFLNISDNLLYGWNRIFVMMERSRRDCWNYGATGYFRTALVLNLRQSPKHQCWRDQKRPKMFTMVRNGRDQICVPFFLSLAGCPGQGSDVHAMEAAAAATTTGAKAVWGAAVELTAVGIEVTTAEVTSAAKVASTTRKVMEVEEMPSRIPER